MVRRFQITRRQFLGGQLTIPPARLLLSSSNEGGPPNVKILDLPPVVHIPEDLPLDAAAPLSCAGVTVFTPVKDHNLHKPTGKKIGVVGLGGLGHVAVKFGKAFGHHVTVISTSSGKVKEAKEHLGADDFLGSTDPRQLQKRKRTLDFILNTVSARHSLRPILELLKVNGTMVAVGAPDQPFELPSFPLIFGKRAGKGSMIGGITEIKEMMDLCGKHKITCDIELTTLDKINDALDCVAIQILELLSVRVYSNDCFLLYSIV